MGMIAGAAQMGGAALQAYGAYKEGKDTAAAYKYNEAVKKREGEMIAASSDLRISQIERQQAKMAGRQHAGYAKSGVVTTSGSPFEVMVDTAGQYEMDKATTRFNADVERSRAGSEQAQYGKAAKNAYSGGLVKAGTTLLSAFSKQVR
jgi:hypothetical protein